MPSDLPVPSDPQGGRLNDLPVETARTFDTMVNEYVSELWARAKSHMRARGSKTLTDADVIDARNELMRHKSVSALRRIVGDGMVIIGSVSLTYWPIGTITGAVLIAGGLYIREWAGD